MLGNEWSDMYNWWITMDARNYVSVRQAFGTLSPRAIPDVVSVAVL